MKKTKQDLIQFVQDNHTWEPRVLKEVMNALKDGEEYLLTAFDDGYELND